jgi:tetratricopeptide (TPR) repeat protein
MATNKNQLKSQDRPFNIERMALLMGRLLILSTLLLVPLFFFTGTWHHYAPPKNAIFQFYVAVLCACWGIIALKKKMVRSPLAAPASLYLCMVLFNSLFAVNMGESWEMITFTFACVMIAFLTPKFITRFRDFEILLYVMGVLCLLIDIYALAMHYNWDPLFALVGPESARYEYTAFQNLVRTFLKNIFNVEDLTIGNFSYQPVSFLGNRNYAAEVLNITTPICAMAMIFFLRYPAHLIFYSFVMLVNVITMFYIDCNASYFGALVAVPVAVVILVFYKVIPWIQHVGVFHASREELEYRTRQGFVIGIVLIAIVGTLIASTDNKVRSKVNTIISWVDMDGDSKPDGNASIIFRLQCMDATMRKIADYPFFGVGAGNFKIVHPLYEKPLERKVLGEETLARKAHNDHLQQAAEYGLFGVFAWYWMIMASFFMAFQSLGLIRKQEMALSGELQGRARPKILINIEESHFYFYLQLGILSGMIVALIDSMFAHTFVITSGAMTFYVAMGISAAVYQRLLLADKGIVLPLSCTTREDSWTQSVLPRLPKSASTVIGYVLILALLLPFGALNMSQVIGEGWLHRAMQARESKRYDLMFDWFENAMDDYPYQMEIYYILGRYYLDVLYDMDETLRSSGDNAASLMGQKGVSIKDRMKFMDRAIVCLQTDLYMNPNYKWAHNNIGVVYDRYAFPFRNPSFFENYLEFDPNDPMKDRVMKAADNTYFRVLQIDDEQIYAHHNLGLGFMHKGMYDKAIQSLEKSIIADPSKTDTYQFLARCFLDNGDPGRALAATDKFLGMQLLALADQLQPSPEQAALIRSIKNDILNALNKRQLDAALDVAANRVNWTNREAYSLYLSIAHSLTTGQVKNPVYAMIAMQRAEKIQALTDPSLIVLAATIYQNADNYPKVIEKYEDLLRLQPNNLSVLRSLSQTHAMVGDVTSALQVFKKVMELEPNRWQNNVSFARILIANQFSWAQISPFVAKAIQLGTDEARAEIVKEDAANLLLPYIKNDPGLVQLLGPAYVPNTSDTE